MEYFKIMDTLDVEMYLTILKMQRPDGQTTGLPQQASTYGVDGHFYRTGNEFP